jgi:hypothetical protein
MAFRVPGCGKATLLIDRLLFFQGSFAGLLPGSSRLVFRSATGSVFGADDADTFARTSEAHFAEGGGLSGLLRRYRSALTARRAGIMSPDISCRP